jgi:hypothetical protein
VLDWWLRDPPASPKALPHLIALARDPRWLHEALTVIERMLPRLETGDRNEALSALFESANRAAENGDGRAAQSGRRVALQVLAQEGSRAAAVAFLLRDDARSRRQDPRLETIDAQRMLQWVQDLLAPGAGAADAPVVAGQCLDLFAAHYGPAAAARACDAILRRRPSALPLWVLRTELLGRAQRSREGLADLRAMLAYVDSEELSLRALTLAARHRNLLPEDRAVLERLSPAALASPAGLLARGLVALRSGQADAAEELLQGTPADADGGHLYYRALANLMRRAPGAAARARDLFAQLDADYPSSSLARYAGSFARQLALSP